VDGNTFQDLNDSLFAASGITARSICDEVMNTLEAGGNTSPEVNGARKVESSGPSRVRVTAHPRYSYYPPIAQTMAEVTVVK
jgi:hypothetical protein